MKATKNDPNQAYKPKLITMNLKNQPTLIFDPSSPQLEWTVADQNQNKGSGNNRNQPSSHTEDQQNQLQQIYSSMVGQVNALNEKLAEKVKFNTIKQKQLNSKQSQINSLKSKYLNLRVTQQQLQKLWEQYSNKFQ